MEELAPTIHRQRLVIEGHPKKIILASDIKDYLSSLSGVLKMKTVLEPITHRSDKYGEAGWIHWESSGAHFYAWDQPMLFFSVDIYTCKPFKNIDAVTFTEKYFNTLKLAYKAF